MHAAKPTHGFHPPVGRNECTKIVHKCIEIVGATIWLGKRDYLIIYYLAF